MRKRSCILLMAFLFVLLFQECSDAAGVNQAAKVLCDIIMLMRGRIARAIAMIAIIGIAVSFFVAKMEWQKIMVLAIGIGLIYGAQTVAYLLLPSTITGVNGVMADGTVYDPNKKYSPEELVRNVCPILSTK